MLKGEWMVEFYAPWCSACEQFKPIWADFSKAMASKNVKVAAVNVDEYLSLSGRFGISSLPTIFHVRDGAFRQYNSDRSLKSLTKYIDNQEWQKTTPLSSYFGPSSTLMTIASASFDVIDLVKDTHDLLQAHYAWPSWFIYTLFALGALSLGILIGFGFLQLLDYCLGGSSKKAAPEDADDLEESDSDKAILSNKQTTDESQDDEEVESDENNSTNGEEEEESEVKTTDQTVRQRRVKN